MEILCTAVLGSETFSNLPDVRIEQVYQNVIKAEFMASGFPPLDTSKIRDILVPTLLISGENSPKIFPLLLDRLQQLLPMSGTKSYQERATFHMRIMFMILIKTF